MKVHQLHEDEPEFRPSKNAKPGLQKPVQSRKASIEDLKAQLSVRSDGAARIARVEMLKAQIKAGTYQVDSTAIAKKMLSSSWTRDLLGNDQRDLLIPEDEE